MTAVTTDQALQRLLEAGRVRALATDPEHARLWDALVCATEGGKRFRPSLVVALHEALGGALPEAAVEVGAAVELLHTSLVIHDDVIDGDHLRRGRLNVSGTFRDIAAEAGADPGAAAGYGRTAAILAGDLALAAAVRAIATCGAPTEVVHRLLDLFDAALHTTAAGELADVRLSLGVSAATLRESLAMEEQKTSAYSFALPLQAGAVLAGADEATTARLGEAGRVLGVAFQLTDDLVGVFGDPTQSGKSATCDLRTGKQTPLLVHARTTPEWTQISPYVGRDLEPDELARVQDMLGTCGSRSFVEDLAAGHLAAAREVIDGLGLRVELVDSVIARSAVLLAPREVAA
ncbi:geranylgeranyl diphosphate synthase, type II [Nocardioides alpinus]|uniref:Geranylgeranyl diphosphate synthase, type II n=1 Tax=Nocardioides alpinus TaxID=748909 RepID=A0A1I1AWJ8_9ACTN|nr:polyprenyl synthetase family protein [Nocardioides alpinus]PKH40962.1 geranylgeranyl pyrophosphate synthase [Nocardioides alpinus]SFB42431.1 geranylgeranyl diphosphate synthase, type II [Nocardioides alpinus]